MKRKFIINTSDEVRRIVIRKAVDLGVTFFDTAQVYTMGTNEELLL
ncbi:MAG: aldo/keto reductase [Muribaculaceae bacterium]|nr:aldo/keto reductase [Muribaculaceae bacterium]